MSRVHNKRGEGDRLRAELIEAATTLLIRTHDLAVPSLREVARLVHISPGAVYLHFPSQAALFEEVLASLFGQLRAVMDAADEPVAPPRERLTAMARAYVHWGVEHPGAYQLLFETPTLSGVRARGDDLLGLIVQLSPVPTEATAFVLRLWSVVHGVTSLRIHKTAASYSASIDADLDALLADILANL